MFVVGHFFIALAQLVSMLLTLFYWILIVRILMTWVNPDPYNTVVRTIYQITDPVLVPLRRYLPLQVGAIDFSPIVAFLLLHFLKYYIVNVLYTFGQRLL